MDFLKSKEFLGTPRIFLAMQIHECLRRLAACVKVTKDDITSQQTDILAMFYTNNIIFCDAVSVLQLCCCRPYKALQTATFYPNVTTLRSGLCCRSSVCRLSSLTLVHPTQGVEPFGKIS